MRLAYQAMVFKVAGLPHQSDADGRVQRSHVMYKDGCSECACM